VAFSDFQCPYCRAIIPTLEQIEETYGDQVRFVFRQFPLTQIHPQAVDAAQASLCADEQDRFWEMHDAMFENQRALEVEQLKSTARSVGLDGPEFDACLDSDRYASQVTEDLEAGRALGITGTPMAFINGRAVSGAKPYEEFAEIIEDELRRLGK
jgi:protein-disulfide isomerase